MKHFILISFMVISFVIPVCSQNDTIPVTVNQPDSVAVKQDSVAAKQDSVAVKQDSVAAKQDSVAVQQDSVVTEPVFSTAEVKPVFPGGSEHLNMYMKNNLQYPKEAIDKHIQGVVFLRFAIMKDGSIGEVKVIHSDNALLNDEAIRLVKNMPKWTPGKTKGQTVNTWFTVPVKFSLSN